jgi:hypothetical protein
MLGMAAGGGAALLADGSVAAPADLGRGLADPERRLRALVMMRGALDDRLVISCISCEYYGVVAAKLTPFFKLTAATFSRWRRTAAGGYEGATYEIEYFIDPATDGVLGAWRNPYTGELVTAHHNDTPPAKFTLDPDGKMEIPAALITPGSELAQEQRPFEVIGDDAWRVERNVATIPVAGAKPVHFDETVSWHARVSDLMAPGRMQARTDVQYLGVSSFRSWQKMGGLSGEMLAMGRGLGGVALEDLPPVWIAATQRRHPGFLADPGAALDPIWKTL